MKDYLCQENVWYNLKVIADKGLIKMFVDDKLVIETRDSSFSKEYEYEFVIKRIVSFFLKMYKNWICKGSKSWTVNNG